jgi:CHAT domain
LDSTASALTLFMIDQAATALRRLLREPASPQPEVKAAAHGLWRLLWQPMAARLAGATHVLISGDGALNLVPFAALVHDAGRYLVETMPLDYVASGREVRELGARGTAKSDPIIIGAPDFGAPGAAAPAIT